MGGGVLAAIPPPVICKGPVRPFCVVNHTAFLSGTVMHDICVAADLWSCRRCRGARVSCWASEAVCRPGPAPARHSDAKSHRGFRRGRSRSGLAAMSQEPSFCQLRPNGQKPRLWEDLTAIPVSLPWWCLAAPPVARVSCWAFVVACQLRPGPEETQRGPSQSTFLGPHSFCAHVA